MPDLEAAGRPIFHLAFPCRDVTEAVDFYRALGCSAGRQNEHAGIIDFFGHQIVAHRAPDVAEQRGIYPRHFGVIVDVAAIDRIEAALSEVAPDRTVRALRFADTPLEHHSLQSRDPSGNVLEFKAYAHPAAIFDPDDTGKIGDTGTATE